MKRPVISDESLEEVLIAIANFQTVSGKKLTLKPKDVLKTWVFRQISQPTEAIS